MPSPKLMLIALIVIAISCSSAQCSLPAIRHLEGRAYISVEAPRPLKNILEAVAEEYGWIINYEDPQFSPQEVRDISVEKWRKSHPLDQGFMVPAGSKFDASWNDSAQHNSRFKQDMLRVIVQQYNETVNPGTFRIVEDTITNALSIVGTSRYSSNQQSSPLDAKIDPEIKEQNGAYALQSAADRCSASSGFHIVLGTLSINALNQLIVRGHAGTVTCRNYLNRILGSAPYPVTYSLLYDFSSSVFILNVTPAHKRMLDVNGAGMLTPVHAGNKSK